MASASGALGYSPERGWRDVRTPEAAKAAWAAWHLPPLCHILFLRFLCSLDAWLEEQLGKQTRSSEWKAGGCAEGCLGPHSLPAAVRACVRACCAWNLGRGDRLLPARGQSSSPGVLTEAVHRCFLVPDMFNSLFSKPQLAVDCLQLNWERKYSEKGPLFPPEPKSALRASLTKSLPPEAR